MTIRDLGLRLGVCAVCAGAPFAVAAQDFTGFYIGGSLAAVDAGGDYTAYTPRNGYAGFDVQDLSVNALGGGLHLGRSWDMGGWILGAEASLIGFGGSETSTRSVEEGTVPPFTREVQNQFALTPRIGLPLGNALVFAKAGLAVSKIGAAHEMSGSVIEGSDTKTGWIIGLGAEIPMTANINARIELTHADHGTDRYDLGTSGRWVEQDLDTDMVTVGFSVYFD